MVVVVHIIYRHRHRLMQVYIELTKHRLSLSLSLSLSLDLPTSQSYRVDSDNSEVFLLVRVELGSVEALEVEEVGRWKKEGCPNLNFPPTCFPDFARTGGRFS